MRYKTTLFFAGFIFFFSGMFSHLNAADTKIGIVVLHGNGHPTKLIEGLVRKLEASNFLVAHPEMPFSSNRHYDKDVGSAVAQIDTAFAGLREKGANKLFLAGHSKGGVFALYYAGNHQLDGLIAIAPGGSVDGKAYRNKIGDAVEKAKQMIGAGEGDKNSSFKDFEGSRGVTSINAPAAAYFSWYDPDGAMNTKHSVKNVNPDTPILWIVAKNDYPGLRKVNIPLFELLPSNPKSKYFEPDTDHKGAPIDSADEIIKWITAVAQ